ncbi:MAG TPA: VOC family protein [Candidatus Acidoferrum sp.]|jgi:catechol 2,3-dioxygenase-like lactoylglutathione lyase family enzyme
MRRRTFVQLGIATALAPPILFAQRQQKSDVPLVDQVPSMLDHILLGCSDLQAGIAFVEQHTGVRAEFGGVHPGRGTENALLSLGERRYLEIIAPDPQQSTKDPLAKGLESLAGPRLIRWAARPGDLKVFAADLARAGIIAEGPTPGSRKRSDGRMLHWQTVNLKDDADGLFPFFIEWSADSPHPSTDAPSGCQLLRFELITPDPVALEKKATRLNLKAPMTQGPTPQLHAVIAGPKGQLDISS